MAKFGAVGELAELTFLFGRSRLRLASSTRGRGRVGERAARRHDLRRVDNTGAGGGSRRAGPSGNKGRSNPQTRRVGA